MITPAALIANAREWCGVKFLHQGRSRLGADCLGFVAACLAELGSKTFLDELPRAYPRIPQRILLDGLSELSREINLEPGALLLFQFPRHADPSHVAIFTGSSIIHSNQQNGGVLEVNYGEPWIRETKKVWALPEVIYT